MRFGGPTKDEEAALKEAMSHLPHVGAVLVSTQSRYIEVTKPVGTRYRVFPLTRKVQLVGLDATTLQDAFEDMIWGRREDEPDDPGGWMPVECLKIEEQ